MINSGKFLVQEEPFSEIVIGDTAIVRAMVEAGVKVVTSYPGSPTPEIGAAIGTIPHDERPFYFEYSTNEKVALEIAYGASINGHLSTVFFKSVGLNVASDTFVQLSHMNLIGGMVVVLGDDPGAHSSQNEQDNRHYAELSYMPVFEPSTPTEIYTFFKKAAEISTKRKMPVILRLTTHTCHQKERVFFDGWKRKEYDFSPKFNVSNGPYVPVASAVFPLKRKALEKLDSIRFSEECRFFNQYINNGSSRGIITMGTTYLSLMELVKNISDKPDILKLGMVYPLSEEEILSFLKSHREVKILEELDPCLEKMIKALAFDNGIKCKIVGKNKISDFIGEYTPDKVREIMSECWSDIFPASTFEKKDIPVPARPAQLCPGCGHRSAYYAIKKVLDENDIKVGDIGCHTLGFLPPYNMVQMLMSMGASTGIASGLSLFNKERKVVCFLGDSTFFHAGMPGIVNAVFNKHNITLIILENGTTAMTGHQEHPGTGHNFDEETVALPIKDVLEGFGIKNITIVDTYQQKKLTEAVKNAVNKEGFSVVIAKHPCMLKFAKLQKRKGSFIQRHVHVDKETCEQIHECLKFFGCPSFSINNDMSVTVNKDLCIGDGSCIQTCPVSAIKYQ